MNIEQCVFRFQQQTWMISHIYTKPSSNSNLQQPASQPFAPVQVLVHPAACRTATRRTPGSCYCYLQGPSCCFLAVWLLFSGVGLTSDSGMLLLLAPPSTNGLDATWFFWSGSIPCLGASDALDECPVPANRQRHGSDADDSGELGGLITTTLSGGGGAVSSLSGLSSNETLQTGQVEFCSSHKSIQAMWKSWPQWGRTRSTSPSSYSARQMTHLPKKTMWRVQWLVPSNTVAKELSIGNRNGNQQFSFWWKNRMPDQAGLLSLFEKGSLSASDWNCFPSTFYYHMVWVLM
jgi:hypothetical protein